MKRVLVTGFEAFDGDAINPSHVLLDYLKNYQFDFQLHTQVLPVSFTRAVPLLDQAIEQLKPTHVVLTGYAHKREVLTIERIGINWVDARIPDNDGLTIKSSKILENGPDGLFSTLPLEDMIKMAMEIAPTKISTSAGEYVCNHVLYSYLNLYPHIPGTFIHIPGAHDHSDFFRAVRAIIESL